MGTGLNVLLTVESSEKSKLTTNYTAIEPYPLSPSITSELNYPALLQSNDAGLWFGKIHSASWGHETRIADFFVLTKINSTLQSAHLSPGFDVVYFDAFAPQKQPEMWTPEVFTRIYGLMTEGGLLVTYCAKGQVKRDLRTAGFAVESLPGPPGKREMIRARKNRIDPK